MKSLNGRHSTSSLIRSFFIGAFIFLSFQTIADQPDNRKTISKCGITREFEKPPEEWEKWDRTSESYRVCCNAVAWAGTALAACDMKAIKLWGHDAHFDYVDRWMREDVPYKEARGKHKRPSGGTTTFGPFFTEMWKAHRKNAPEQDMAGNHRKWVWQGNKGAWIPNKKVPEKYGPAYPATQSGINNQRIDGYRGIWFELGQKYEFGDKYSGALGTYTSMHIPLAAYSEKDQKTFFVYGGTTGADKRYLLCMIGEYDHKTGKVSKPVVVHDKEGVEIDLLVSWNFKHIVNIKRIRGYNGVNIKNGYPAIEIRSPKDLIDYEND